MANKHISIRYYLSDRFRLRMEESGLEQMTEGDQGEEDEEGTLDPACLSSEDQDHSSDKTHTATNMETFTEGAVIRTLDGEMAGDEFAQDAMNYQILLGKIDTLLDSLTLDA